MQASSGVHRLRCDQVQFSLQPLDAKAEKNAVGMGGLRDLEGAPCCRTPSYGGRCPL
jgi:hypothetical protein